MAFPALRDPHTTPVHILFPEQYAASKRMIAKDFLFFGTAIVASIVIAAWFNVNAF